MKQRKQPETSQAARPRALDEQSLVQADGAGTPPPVPWKPGHGTST